MDKIAQRDFTEGKIIVNTSYDLDFENQLYQYTLYKKNSFNYYVSFPNAFFMNENLAKELLSTNGIDKEERESLIDLVRLQNHAIRTNHFNIIINVDYFLRQIVKKEVAIGTKRLKMTKTQFDRYIANLIEALMSDTQNQYFMINGFGMTSSHWRFNNNIFCSDHLYCVKKPYRSVDGENDYNYVYSSDHIIKADLIRLSSLVEDDRYLIPNGHEYLAQLIEAAVSTVQLSDKK